jgi:hypothetical protein
MLFPGFLQVEATRDRIQLSPVNSQPADVLAQSDVQARVLSRNGLLKKAGAAGFTERHVILATPHRSAGHFAFLSLLLVMPAIEKVTRHLEILAVSPRPRLTLLMSSMASRSAIVRGSRRTSSPAPAEFRAPQSPKPRRERVTPPYPPGSPTSGKRPKGGAQEMRCRWARRPRIRSRASELCSIRASG